MYHLNENKQKNNDCGKILKTVFERYTFAQILRKTAIGSRNNKTIITMRFNEYNKSKYFPGKYV